MIDLTSSSRPTPSAVLVLAGGPDAEREVSLSGAAAVTAALRAAGFSVSHHVIDRPTSAELAAMPGEVILPILHGPFGEGGPLQDLLEADGRPYLGARPRAARLAMDKVATKSVAAALGLAVTPTALFDPSDPVCPLPFPVVLKPVREGSTIGLHVCRDQAHWDHARRLAAESRRQSMVEPFIAGRELTAAVVLGSALPLIEIRPAAGLYDYAAKYQRTDTRYAVAPELPSGLTEAIQSGARRLAVEIGADQISRVDLLLDDSGIPWVLEINTMPGFTDHSLVPMAARAAGIDMPDLCARLVMDTWSRAAGRPAAEGACA